MGLKFPEPSKLEVLDDAIDMSVLEPLPSPTHWFCVVNGDTEFPNEWDSEEERFEMTFNPAGTYEFVLKADGYDDKHFVINVVPAPSQPYEPQPGVIENG